MVNNICSNIQLQLLNLNEVIGKLLVLIQKKMFK